MKNKKDVSRGIMERIIRYEKKKLRIWYEVVVFVLMAILISEVLIAIDLFWDMQERSAIDFRWVFAEDFETIKILSGSIANVLIEELPWIKIGVLFLTSVTLILCSVYALKRSRFKRLKANQIQKYEKTKNS